MGENASATERVRDVRLDVAPDPELEPEAAERVVRRLRAELDALDVESVRFAPGAAPPDGAKGADAVTLGAIIVALSAPGGVFTSLVGAVQDWLNRSADRHRVSVTIDGDTIVLEAATDAERRALVEAFVRRHSGEGQ